MTWSVVWDEGLELTGMGWGGPLLLGPSGFTGARALRWPSGSSALDAGPGVIGPSFWTRHSWFSSAFAQSLWHCLSSFFWEAAG